MTPSQSTKIDALPVHIYPTNRELGNAAARQAVRHIRQAVRDRGTANIILATGNSQLTFLAALQRAAKVPWERVRVFHMDEYVGIDPQHPASFSNFLHRNLLDQVKPLAFYPVPGTAVERESACRDYESLLREYPADLCVLGIGENGHLAFNDPPCADFRDPLWVKVVQLAEASRLQQVGEGHFALINDVPTHAITLTIPALMAAGQILAVVPEARKAGAIYQALRKPISADCPASILRQTSNAILFLDVHSAAQAFPEAVG
jgi:glucosamine-6-phosphate deaminase